MSVSTELEILVESNGDLVMNNLRISAEKLSKAIEGVHKVQKSAFESMASTISSVTIAVRGVSDSFQQLAQPVQDFDKAMRAANTMAGKDAAGFKELTGQVKDLSKEIPIARELLANGLYQTISNGVPEDNWIEFLRASARSAVGGMANLEEVVKVTSTVIKNYGLDWEQAAAIQDKIQLTAKNGVTSFEQLAAALPRVTGNAATLGVSIDELMATFSTLTGVSGNTAEVSTQLAAVFTALIKPSSEATKMAAQMGLQFNAAAITSAGGLQNFLRQLDAAVKSYAASSGVLEQEVYGRLFGSAESLRAIGPLTGELATKFQENVSAMTGSAGTMDAAFETMASTGESVAQRIKNQLQSITDITGQVAAACLPYIQYVSSLGMALSGAGTIATTAKSIFSSLKEVITKYGLAAKISTALTAAWNKVTQIAVSCARSLKLAFTSIGQSATVASRCVNILKLALKGLMATTAIGAVFMAISYAVELFANKADKAKEKAEELAAKEKEFNDWKASLTDISQSVADSSAKEILALDNLYKAATDETKSRKERLAAANELKKTYSDTFANLKTEAILAGEAATAYNNLKDSIIAVATANAARAKIEKNQEEWLELEMQKTPDLTNLVENGTDLINAAKSKEQHLLRIYNNMSYYTNGHYDKDKVKKKNAAWKDYTSAKAGREQLERDVADARVKNYEIDTSQTEITSANEKLKKYTEGPAKRRSPNGVDSSPNTPTAKPATLEDSLRNRLREKETKYVELGMSETADPDAMANLKKEIADIYAELAKIDGLKKQVAAPKPVDVDPTPKTAEQVTTYAELDEALRGHQKLLDNATVGERAAIAKQIKALEDLRDKWNKALQVPPGAPDTLQALDEINAAIEYYNTQLKNAEGTSKTDIENTLAQLKARSKTVTRQERVVNRNVELDNELEEVNAINSLSGHDYMIKVRDMGFDSLGEKIKALNMELATLGDGPDTDGQRRKIEELIKNYKQMRNASMMSVEGFEAVWGATKGVTSSIKAATEAVKGDGSAWEKTVSVVDAAVSVYKSLTQGYQLLAPLITAITALKKVETTATQEQTGANMANAASGALAANAAIPVVGVAMGVAAVAAIIAAMASVPKYADGGIAYGPTIGMFGEYPGASHNPEVVAPLDRLRSMIQPAGMDGRVEFEIDGTKLRGVLRRVDSRTSRT